jgi:hypothetical protein
MTGNSPAVPNGRLQSGAFPRWLGQVLAFLMLLAVALPGPVRAQAPAAPAAPPTATFSEAELDQMLAPIALYPDSLLAQVLMASTYPADVKEAAAWSKAHPDTKGDAAIEQVKDKDWEASVASLVAFPQVLAMMDGKPDQVQKIGDAFLADPARVMDRVQFLRKKAQDAGNLKTTEQQKVSTTTENNKQVIVVEPAQPSSVYVPVYQPSVVYGSWWYPSYPPYYWPPPPYYYPGGAFVAGVVWGAAVVGIANGLWGGCNWGGGDVNINVNKFNNINTNRQISNTNNKFEHNAARRGEVPYRDSKSNDKYGKKAQEGAKNREAYRGKEGRDAQPSRDAQRNQASETLKARGADPAAGREALQGADRDRANQAVQRSDRAQTGARDAGGGARNSGGGAHNTAFSGARDSGASRANADRGRASSSSMAANRGGGGGGARAGGGGGGGRRR